MKWDFKIIFDNILRSSSHHILLLFLTIVLFSCANSNRFTVNNSKSIPFGQIEIEIQKGTYLSSFLNLTIRISIKTKSQSKLILDETRNGIGIEYFKFENFIYNGNIILFNKNKEFFYFVIDQNGKLISKFPYSNFKINKFNINYDTKNIEITGLNDTKKRHLYSQDMGITWKSRF